MDAQIIKEKIIIVRDQPVILDSDVAELYGVETKRVNEAVRNNPEKFPDGYIMALSPDEAKVLRSKISTLKPTGRGQHTKYAPKVFTEKGLYMLATILKSPVATQTTIAIIETFAKVRELSRTMQAMTETPDEPKQRTLLQKGGKIISDLLDENLTTEQTETTLELNFVVVKVKHTVTRKPEK